MKDIKDFLNRTGFQSIALLIVAIFIFLFTGNFLNPFGYMCLGAFIWGNLNVIKNIIKGVKLRNR